MQKEPDSGGGGGIYIQIIDKARFGLKKVKAQREEQDEETVASDKGTARSTILVDLNWSGSASRLA